MAKAQDTIGKRPLWALAVFHGALGLSRAFAGLEYQGLENLPDNEAFILAANHLSYLDGLWVMGGLSKAQFSRATALAGADLSSDHGFIGKLIMAVAQPIKIERHGNPVRGLIMAKRALQSGHIVLIHPEGTRSHDGFLAPLLSGAGYLGIKAKVPTVPVFISGAYDFYSRHHKRPSIRPKRTGKKAKLTVNFLPPIAADTYQNAHDLSAAIHSALYDAETAWLESDEGRKASIIPAAEDWTRQARPPQDLEA
ncbi:MAG: lysophospholipid acyltransferase family protein [Eubacteriales bacterium]|nr:lysophospholipid acyltransferase family protein [Eubacteriales bacterium]